uniref:Uncharacterized protein n=1 Tax=Anopheles atroparvus TaxID=41427 RepID=A0A182IZT5_ANOAO
MPLLIRLCGAASPSSGVAVESATKEQTTTTPRSGTANRCGFTCMMVVLWARDGFNHFDDCGVHTHRWASVFSSSQFMYSVSRTCTAGRPRSQRDAVNTWMPIRNVSPFSVTVTGAPWSPMHGAPPSVEVQMCVPRMLVSGKDRPQLKLVMTGLRMKRRFGIGSGSPVLVPVSPQPEMVAT